MQLSKTFQLELHDLRLRLGADFAIISRIKGHDYEVIDVESDLKTINQGDHFETRNTYCNRVIETNDTISYSEVGKIGSMVLHPIYTAMQLEAYLGVPLQYEGNVIGTLNFSGFSPKNPQFTESEIRSVQKLGKEIENAIHPESI